MFDFKRKVRRIQKTIEAKLLLTNTSFIKKYMKNKK